MKPQKGYLLLFWVLVCPGVTVAIEPISTTIAVGMAAALTGFLARYQNIFYYFHECCRPDNAGGERIVETALDFWRGGRAREEIELKDLETSVSLSIFNNENSGFFRTSLIDKNLVDFFVPFLPLEYSHVVQCAMAEMKIRASEGEGPPDLDVANQVAKDLVYFPKTERVFSVKGCKTIESKLDYYS
ncbi:Torsin-1A [Oryzias melastigma]|uniref:Torsin-1A n=1 Tax=Oryzias melastigma TaxID=30732 RepID=A0A834F4J1_ORYME|nr:Torsin-1A [Oryzias melastigma]